MGELPVPKTLSDAQGAAESSAAVHQARGLYRVSLTESCNVVERGEQLLSWLVELDGRWVPSGAHPRATLESETGAERHSGEQCPSGTVWQRHVELSLARGTRLRCRRSWPRVRRLSVMGYLNGGFSQSQRVVEEREFVVVGNYRLLPVGRMQTKAATSAARSSARSPRPPEPAESGQSRNR